MNPKENIKIRGNCYKLVINRENGAIEELRDKGDLKGTNLVLGAGYDYKQYTFGRLFLSKNSICHFISLKLKNYSKDKHAEFTDNTGRNFIRYNFFKSFFEIDFSITGNNSDRAGIELDFNFVNCPGTKDWQNQIIPASPYLEKNNKNGFYLMSRPMGRYIILVFPEPISCWRIKYSDFGHHLLGFQVLLKVEDLKFRNNEPLPAYKRSSIRIGFAQSPEDAYLKISEMGGFPVVFSPTSGGINRTNLPIKVVGNVDDLTLINPDLTRENITSLLDKNKTASILLEKPGKYQIAARYGDKESLYSFYSAPDWENMIKKAAEFGAEHFQLEKGCFARAVDSNTLDYKGLRVIGGYSFGNPYEEHSCASGEFGGFLCWSGLKSMLQFGETDELKESAQGYFLSWALQRKAKENNYFPNAISPVEQEFMGYKFSPGHIYKEQLYIQHEGWFLEEFCDYFLLTGERSILKTIELIASHMIDEHQDENGALINISCHNNGVFQRVDYTTCSTPVIGLIRAGNLLKSEKILLGAEKACDHLVNRGLIFPTETIPGVEFIDEGSMACTALTLIYAYLNLKRKSEYRDTAQELLSLHESWIIKTPLISLFGSSFRYWENTWETRDWGASINGGHAWTIWTSEAKYYNYFIERRFNDLVDSFSGFVSNMPKVQEDGAIYSNFTPDYITGKFDHNGYKFEPRFLANNFPIRTYSASGSYFLIRASETWFFTSAIGFWNGKLLALNGILEKNSKFLSHAPHFKNLAIEKRVGRIILDHEGTLEIFKSIGLKQINMTKGKILSESPEKLIVESEHGKIIFSA